MSLPLQLYCCRTETSDDSKCAVKWCAIQVDSASQEQPPPVAPDSGGGHFVRDWVVYLLTAPHDGCPTTSGSTTTRPSSAAFRFTCRTTRSRYAVSYAASPCAT